MKWVVIDSIVNPETGMAFSCIITDRELKLIIWYKANGFLFPGDELITSDLGLFINGRSEALTLCNISPFSATFWQTVFRQSRCPGNAEIKPGRCDFGGVCHVKNCPYGLA